MSAVQAASSRQDPEETSNPEDYLQTFEQSEKVHPQLLDCPYIGAELRDKYHIKAIIGKGSWGTVLECYDWQSKRDVAVKIYVFSPRCGIDPFKNEVKGLKKLAENQIQGFQVHIDSFVAPSGFYGILVSELLRINLSQFLKCRNGTGLAIPCIRHIMGQLLRAMHYIHCIKMIHTDLKCTNICLYGNLKKVTIKVIDLGNWVTAPYHRQKEIQTPQYRAPEACFYLPVSTAIDMWSVGCIMFELMALEKLFTSTHTPNLLAAICSLIKPVPHYMIRKTTRTELLNYFPKRKQYPNPNRPLFKEVITVPSVPTTCVPKLSLVLALKRSKRNSTPQDEDNYYELLTRLLEVDPKTRITAAKALQSKFMTTTPGQEASN